MKRISRARYGFTLIELLIVIAIIAILALIAIPNFLEAQTRSKVARCMADMRSIATALEAYYVDYNAYPHLAGYLAVRGQTHGGIAYGGNCQFDRAGIVLAWGLTTPVAYITNSRIFDPFCREKDFNIVYDVQAGTVAATLNYMNIYMTQRWDGNFYTATPTTLHWSQWLLVSYGPDYVKGPDPRGIVANWGLGSYASATTDPQGKYVAWAYDPSNGTVSNGDILRWQASAR
ncbi:MAG: prepilin-type N-terminal cleavage/methylation domain-containing protein [Candidatus Sumerlaeota bacterium]|nr:prepilin-type N-terminal cleavage/methylation domain-containing protein [Candidatus Sumerlaeota bacterium]